MAKPCDVSSILFINIAAKVISPVLTELRRQIDWRSKVLNNHSEISLISKPSNEKVLLIMQQEKESKKIQGAVAFSTGKWGNA